MRREQKYELEHFGVVRTDRMRYAPLERAVVSFECRARPSETFTVKVYDGAGLAYFRDQLTMQEGLAEFALTVGGVPGMHIVRVFAADMDPDAFYSFRAGSFVLEAETSAAAEGTDIDAFFRWLADSLVCCQDRALYGGRWVVGDKAADNSTMNLAYPRFRLDSTVYLEDAETLKGHLQLCYDHQRPDGSLYDHIYGDDHPGWDGERRIRSMMADLETGLIINVYQAWMATGDTAWMTGLLEPMLRGWRYATTSPELWSEEYGLIKKPHTPDEWDFQIGDESCFRNENSRYVVACCDAVRLPRAADCLAAMLHAVGRGAEAEELRVFAREARERANALLWDGTKYRHHQHIDPMDHGDFNEDEQLVMSNTWACNDGLASHEQAVLIIEEYERRLRETGDRYPWWSLQPGYPDGTFPRKPRGVYANGGLFPWVGGQLCRACFQHGFEDRGWRLLREFWERVEADDGACMTWYTLDGRAAANTDWTTNYDAWGIAAWGQAAIEGLVGVVPLAPAFERCRCTPQWYAGGVVRAEARIAMPASRSYFAYRYARDDTGLSLLFTGSGCLVDLRIPVRACPDCREVSLDGTPVDLVVEHRNGVAHYAVDAGLTGVHVLRLATA